ncbi:hypothetical protein D915_007954 [Fasciola hepatica]|uniref:Uncharacterized protein n=1 Tax=Fasciola hepatica TaxID=6192 RepID=A0A4E0RJJ0_FASHE|nr:hypothetical protein D915_007954 [Fasciola hepatica]
MDVEGIPETTVDFKIFPVVSITSACLEQKRRDYMEYLSPWILNYPWFREVFSIRSPSFHQTRAHLSGRVNFGESIEDEWFIVWLLVQISRLDSSVIIQIIDEDGQFLLIEAADELPKWLSPDNATNRVWIHNGLLCIIQLDVSKQLSVADSLDVFAAAQVSKNRGIFSSEELQSTITKRIHGYPERIEKIKHTAHVKLPYPAAAVLALPEHNALVRSALSTWAIHHSDPIVMRTLRKHLKTNSALFCQAIRTQRDTEKVGEPNQWPLLRSQVSEFVFCTCTLSRIQYAKWRSLPTPTGIHFPESSASSSDRLAIELGLKLIVGLEIMLMKAKSNSHERPMLESQDLDSSSCTSWDRYFSRLNAVGYFRNELPGSQLHNDLTKSAKEFFITHIIRESDQSKELSGQSQLGSLLRQILTVVEQNPDRVPSLEEFRAREQSLQPPDDESWLYITPEQLDDMVTERNGIKANNFDDVIQDRKPGSVIEMLDKFVAGSSSYEGVELDGARLGGKRKCTPHGSGADVSTDDEDEDDDAERKNNSSCEDKPWDLVSEDSEDGFNECGPTGTSSKAEGSLNMYDMMRSLLSKINDPFCLDSKKSTSETTRSNPTGRSIVSKTNTDVFLSSDSSSEELLDLYGPNTDRHADYASSLSSSSSYDEDGNDSNNGNENGSVLKSVPRRLKWWQRKKAASSLSNGDREKQAISDFLPFRDTHRTNGTAIVNDQLSQFDCTRHPAESETAQTVCSMGSGQSWMSQPRSGIAERENTDLTSFYAQMEKELAGQPANIGRLVELTASQNPEFGALNGRDRHGLSGRKKLRPNPRRARLAHAEEFESDDSDEDLEITTNTEPRPSSSHAAPPQRMSDHVMRNLCASIIPPGSEWQPPTGPAAQLFTALGIPVNQIGSAKQTNSRN